MCEVEIADKAHQERLERGRERAAKSGSGGGAAKEVREEASAAMEARAQTSA